MSKSLAPIGQTRGYRVELQEEDDGTWTASIPDLPGCVASGRGPDQAVESVADAILAWIDAANEVGRAIPVPTAPDDEYSGRFVVRLPKSVHRALAVRAALDGVSLNTYCVAALTSATTSGLPIAKDLPAEGHRQLGTSRKSLAVLEMLKGTFVSDATYLVHSVAAVSDLAFVSPSTGSSVPRTSPTPLPERAASAVPERREVLA